MFMATSTTPVFGAAAQEIERNPGIPLDLGWVNTININTNGVISRAGDLATRRSVKKDHQVAWLLKAITHIDLTTLSGDDTQGKVKRLCAKAKRAIDPNIRATLGLENSRIPNQTGAVCVYHNHVAEAVEELKGRGIPVAVVSTNFPDGQGPMETMLEEIRHSVAAGAEEVDIVLTREHVLKGDWQAVYDQVKAYREACGEAHLKAILGTGNLGSFDNIAKASLVSMMAGADFIKTSTGKESLNATLPISLVMIRQIRDYADATGFKVGYKPAGGISSAKDALTYLSLIKEELGNDWLVPELFRFGASSLLGDIERQLDHQATGQYSAPQRIALS